MNIKKQDLLDYNDSSFLVDSLVVYNKNDDPINFYLYEIQSKENDEYIIKQLSDGEETLERVPHNKINQLTFNYKLLDSLGLFNAIDFKGELKELEDLYQNLSKPWNIIIRNIDGKTHTISAGEYFMRTWNHDNVEAGENILTVLLPYVKASKDNKWLYTFVNTYFNTYIINTSLLSYIFNFPEKIQNLKSELMNDFTFSKLENFFKKNKLPLITSLSFIPPVELLNKEENDYHYRWRMPFEFSIISSSDNVPFFKLDDNDLQSFREELKLLKNKHSKYPLIKNYENVISHIKNKVMNAGGNLDDKSDFSSSSINIEEDPEEDIEAELEDTGPEEEKEEEPEPEAQTEEEKEEEEEPEPQTEEDDELNILNDFDFEIPEIPSESKNEGMTTNISRKNKESIQIYVEKGNDGANDEIRAFVDLGGNPEEWFNALITNSNDTEEGGDDNNEEGGDDNNEEGGDDDNEEGDNNNEEGGDDNEEGGDDKEKEEEDDIDIREKVKKQLEEIKQKNNELSKKKKLQKDEISNFK